MLGEFGLTWPWESLHVEALAWFDHWLKDRDTGILDGDPIRYWMPGADEWRTSDSVATRRRRGCAGCALRADGVLGDDEGAAGAAVVDGARDRAGPGEAERDRPAALSSSGRPRRSTTRSTSPAISSSSCTPPPPRSTRHGSSPCRTSPPTTPSSTSPPDSSAPVSAAVDAERSVPGAPVLPCRDERGRCARVQLTVYRCRSSPTPAASTPAIASGSCSPATTRTPRCRRSWASATRASAPAASTRSTPSSRLAPVPSPDRPRRVRSDGGFVTVTERRRTSTTPSSSSRP